MSPQRKRSRNDNSRSAEPSPELLHKWVVEVLSERRKPAHRGTPLNPPPFPRQSERESYRQAIALLFEKPVAEVNDAVVDEIIANIQAEAADNAALVGEYLQILVPRLRSLHCTTREAVAAYFAAADHVLEEFYAELQRPNPSPTRVRQCAVQYALDPRRPIAALAHEIVIRPRDDGYEIAVAPPGLAPLPSLPLPGRIVRDHFARWILDLLTEEPPRYRDLMQLIEMLLGFVPPPHSAVMPGSQPITSANAVQVDVAESCILVAGRRYVVDLQLVRLLQRLREHPGNWVSSTYFAEDPLFASARIDRLVKKLPQAVQELIESRVGKGYRLRLEQLEKLCHKSSIDLPAATVDHA